MKAPKIQEHASTHEVRAEQHQRKQKHIHRVRKVPGLSLWEINLKDLTICRATLVPQPVTKVMKGGLQVSSTNHVLQVREGCQYVQALNCKNAVRKWQSHTGLMYALKEVKA